MKKFLKNLSTSFAIIIVLIATSAVSEEDIKNTKISYGDQFIIDLLKRD